MKNFKNDAMSQDMDARRFTVGTFGSNSYIKPSSTNS